MKIFEEHQRFTQWWIWVILIGIFGLSAGGFIYQLTTGQAFGSKPMNNTGFFVIVILNSLLLLLFFLFQLKTRIDEVGVHYQFKPFHTKMRTIKWDEIEKAEIRNYKPLQEYGGWGIRGFASDRALNVSGKVGLQLYLKNGDKLLIGTQKSVELEKALNENFLS
jgi:hypothetical protein